MAFFCPFLWAVLRDKCAVTLDRDTDMNVRRPAGIRGREIALEMIRLVIIKQIRQRFVFLSK